MSREGTHGRLRQRGDGSPPGWGGCGIWGLTSPCSPHSPSPGASCSSQPPGHEIPWPQARRPPPPRPSAHRGVPVPPTHHPARRSGAGDVGQPPRGHGRARAAHTHVTGAGSTLPPGWMHTRSRATRCHTHAYASPQLRCPTTDPVPGLGISPGGGLKAMLPKQLRERRRGLTLRPRLASGVPLIGAGAPRSHRHHAGPAKEGEIGRGGGTGAGKNVEHPTPGRLQRQLGGRVHGEHPRGPGGRAG